MKNLHLIRASKSRLYYTISMSGYNLKLSAIPYHQSSEIRPQHLYIPNDEEIKEGAWAFDGLHIFKCLKPFIAYETTSGKNIPCFYIEYDGKSNIFHETSYIKKIILTTDQDLIKKGVQAIDDDFLEWFIKNPSCEKVKIIPMKLPHLFTYGYKPIIPQEEPKDVILGYKTSLDAQMLDKIEPKQETTLEEIAKKVYPDNIVQLSPTFFHNTADIRRHDFIQGYNLHKGELYSEEEVIKLLIYCKDRFGGSGLEDYTSDSEVKQWFEQFKKK